ncbi:exosome complex component RRP4 homolog [Magnolia sinica]|uniref:exosome complex component RRP4 homolog n=1 Tax=Magnolia sinica TaxID=86752 RepID=UPI00265B2582|nr:exosome complex component RRP4 homolog [Magnolia sinica]
MREILQQLSLNQTQKIRLEAALQQLEESSKASSSSSSAIITVADTIPVNHEDGVLKGHGTSELDGEVVATLCGVLERVNKLVYVRALRARYKPEVGDIIVGRVLEIAPKRWRLEVNFSQDAVLMLSAMNMPDGIQRRRTAVDELNMRSIFEENDVVCAEVRGVHHDGSLQLQARSQKYGKLERGQLLTVPPYLVKRRKQHFHHLEQYGIDLILGCNGFIWVAEHVEMEENEMIEDQENKLEENSKTNKRSMTVEELERSYTPLETRRNICRIANAVRVLSMLGFIISVEVIIDTAEASSFLNIEIKDMLGAEFCVQIAEREAKRRNSLVKKKG